MFHALTDHVPTFNANPFSSHNSIVVMNDFFAEQDMIPDLDESEHNGRSDTNSDSQEN